MKPIHFINNIFDLLIIFITILSLYFLYNVYKINKLLDSVQTKNNSKIIFIRDIKLTKFNSIIYSIYSIFFGNIVISINDENLFSDIISQHENYNLDIIIESVGGSVFSNDKILNIIDNFENQISIYVPRYAMSAATLITLASDKIYLDKYAWLGPTDPQITISKNFNTVSFKALMNLINLKPISNIDDQIILDYLESKVLYEQNINQTRKYINKHAKKGVNNKIKNNLIKKFSYGDISHYSSIDYHMLNPIIEINPDIPEDILDIYNNLSYWYKYM